jgi:membrane associated rhomboid family serine protease
MVLIPTGPDGKVHYKAYLTTMLCGLATVFSMLGFWSRSFSEGYSMELTRIVTLHWFTAPLIHQNFGQLLLNVTFLWMMGQLLEGRFGFWKYLGAVLVIGWTHTMSSQLFFFWMDAKGVMMHGHLRGLFAINFGLLVLALIYIYDRKLSFLWHMGFMQGRFGVNVMTLSAIYLLASSGVLIHSGRLSDYVHYTGFLIGLLFVIFLTMSGIIAEQGANLLERVFGQKFVRHEIELNPKTDAETELEQREQERVEWDESLPNLIRMADEGQFEKLHLRMAKLLARNRFAVWDSELLRKLIQSYTKVGNWVEANRYLYIFQQTFPEQMTVPLLLSWTHVQLELGRPRSAAKTLKSLEGVAVRADQKAIFIKLAARVRELVLAGTLEPDLGPPV